MLSGGHIHCQPPLAEHFIQWNGCPALGFVSGRFTRSVNVTMKHIIDH